MESMRAPLIRCSTFIAILLLCACGALAGTTGKISGKIVDAQTKEGLAGVNVLIVGTTMGGASDVDGEYFILNIPPGTYSLKASAVGYTPVTVGSVNVTVDQTTRITFTLQSTAVEVGEVTVTASRPIVQRDLTSTVSSVSSEQLSKLPLEDVNAVVNLQAGVVEGHFRGGRTGEVKYLIDGVPVNDVFSGSSSVEAEVNTIQEIQVLSGTFNAEYGEALSGVVNQVTKTATETYAGEFSLYAGDYASSGKDANGNTLFQNIDHPLFRSLRGRPMLDLPFYVYSLQGSLSGPVPSTGNLVKFYLSGRSAYDDGYIYGRRMFNPSDSSYITGNDPTKWHIGATGDNAYVPMNYSRRGTLQGKLDIGVGTGKGIILNFMYQDLQYKVYDHQFQLNPDGDYTYFQKGYLASASYTHVFNDASFLDVNGSVFITNFKQYVLKDPIDPDTSDLAAAVIDQGYVNPARLRDAGLNAFLTGGMQNWHFNHVTRTETGRMDFTSQVTTMHQIKAGGEVDLHHLQYKDYLIVVDGSNGFIPVLPAPGSFDFNFYSNHPYQIAAYVQDKIELEYLVVNIGLRYDYFQPDGRSLIDPNNIAGLDTLSPQQFPASAFRRVSAKSQVSPRIGLSYPITDRGAVHFSYGHFFQVPPFEFLYKNPNFRVSLQENLPEIVNNTLGNADLQPQRTTMYEVGLQQELTPELGVTLTAYYKDIRNLLGLELYVKNNVQKFGQYINRDYGAVKGFTISLDKRLSGGFGANIDYTFQIAQGDASDPNDVFNKAQATPPIEANKQLVPLDWDRRHSLNATITLGEPSNYIASVIGRLGSGLPYTPAFQNQRTGLENSDTRPLFYNFDLYITKYLKFYNLDLSVFVKIYNVFDTRNEINVFTDTGRAGYSLELTRAQVAPQGVNTIQQYYTRPDFFSAPRQVLVGLSFTF